MSDFKLSIVIPTMWKFEPFYEFLQYMCLVDTVGEVILIDNNETDRPNIEFHPKVKIHNFNKNIYVNPAWNYGISVAENDNICVLNDDVLVDLKLFYKIKEVLKPGRLVVVAANYNKEVTVTGQQHVVARNTVDPVHWGCCWFIHRSDWVEVPAGMDIYHGDHWIEKMMEMRGKEIVAITDIFFHTPMSATQKFVADEVWYHRESLLYGHLLQNYYNRYINTVKG